MLQVKLTIIFSCLDWEQLYEQTMLPSILAAL